MRRIFTLLMMMLLFFIYFTVGVSGSASLGNEQLPPGDGVKNILKKVSPSIVKVVSENHKRYIATGIVIDTNQVISSTMVTNHPYESLYVETAAGEQYEAIVLGKDQETSLLLLQINERSLPPIPRADDPEVGDWVALVGVFYQEFPSIFQGFISSQSDERLILNAPVAPGSAGGAVVNKKGELIGVVRGLFDFTFSPDYTYRDQSYEFLIRANRASNKDLCYAVPMSKVAAVVKDLQKYGKIMRGWLGVTLNSRGKNDSAEINDIALDSPAEKAGFRKGDKILTIKNKPVQTGSDVIRIVKTLKPGDNVKIEYARGNIKKTAQVAICEPKEHFEWRYPAPPAMEAANNPPVIPEIENTLPRVENFVVNFSGSRSLGVEIMPLTPELAQKFNIKEGCGLLISKVHKQTAAEKSGFQAADIIVRADGKIMKQNVDLRRALNELLDNQPVTIDVYRAGKLKTFNVIPGKETNQNAGQYDDMLEMFKDRLNEIKARMGAEGIAGENVLPNLRKDAEIIKYREEIERLKKVQAALLKQLENVKKQKELEQDPD
ncbi:MAG TPA: PDZ domain-containing protein [Candidatus Kapabacteria bacterium]|nr:PDZ domain-containing protein [Candidatus Kapabacteria bacterium]